MSCGVVESDELPPQIPSAIACPLFWLRAISLTSEWWWWVSYCLWLLTFFLCLENFNYLNISLVKWCWITQGVLNNITIACNEIIPNLFKLHFWNSSFSCCQACFVSVGLDPHKCDTDIFISDLFQHVPRMLTLEQVQLTTASLWITLGSGLSRRCSLEVSRGVWHLGRGVFESSQLRCGASIVRICFCTPDGCVIGVRSGELGGQVDALSSDHSCAVFVVCHEKVLWVGGTSQVASMNAGIHGFPVRRLHCKMISNMSFTSPIHHFNVVADWYIYICYECCVSQTLDSFFQLTLMHIFWPAVFLPWQLLCCYSFPLFSHTCRYILHNICKSTREKKDDRAQWWIMLSAIHWRGLFFKSPLHVHYSVWT